MIAFILLVIGGLNWGLYIFGWDVARLFSLPDMVSNIIYALVALSAIVLIFTHKKTCKMCGMGGGAPMSQTM